MWKISILNYDNYNNVKSIETKDMNAVWAINY